jgi:epoxyqueuosine reductase
VPHERGFTRTQIALQLNQRIANRRLTRQCLREHSRGRFVRPDNAFYNGQVVVNSHQLVFQIQAWARELGFSQIGVAGVDLTSAEPGLLAWLAAGFHGDMHYMAAHGLKRARPAELIPGTVSVITARMDYLPASTPAGDAWQAIEFRRLQRPSEGIVSVYARGRDYHKVMRSRLQTLSEKIAAHVEHLGHRVFTDSAPVLEAELAARSGQGWRGKHTLLLNREAGSMFFLGEIYVDLALPASEPVTPHCGSCTACIDICPTQAIIAPHRLDARRCISYLTIEHAGSIPLELRALIGNRIYGCDDCQLICPWNKFARRSALPDFDERAGLTGQQLVTLFDWTEAEFLRLTEGSPIRRIGHERWLRNVAVAMGNALHAVSATTEPARASIRASLVRREDHPAELVREHVQWALGR